MNRYSARVRLSLLGAGLIAAAGCDLTNTDPPSTAHYRLTSSNPVQLITSTVFTLTGSAVSLLEADTVVTTSAELDVDLDSPPRFFIQANALTPGTQVSLRVDVGERNWYDNTRTFSPPDKLEFAYGFTGSAF
jgi:hypothetical protein